MSGKDGEIVGLVVLPSDPRKDRRYPLWDVEELQKEQDLARERIKTYELAIEDQQQLIADHDVLIAKCQERDRELAKYFEEMEDLRRKHGPALDQALRGE